MLLDLKEERGGHAALWQVAAVDGTAESTGTGTEQLSGPLGLPLGRYREKQHQAK